MRCPAPPLARPGNRNWTVVATARSMKLISLVTVAAFAVAALLGAAAWRTGIVAVSHETGYFAPLFARNGETVLAISREVRADVAGFGREFFTPPASVRLVRDRFRLIEIRVADRRVTVVGELPPSPLEGRRIHAYHGSIFGVPHAHLRWGEADRLELEVAVTRHDAPRSQTFVLHDTWSAQTRSKLTGSAWQEQPTRMAGDEPQQLHGDLEAIAVPGDELMPCAIALLRRDGSSPTPLIETRTCRDKYPSGISPAVLTPISHRPDIERAELITSTYARLVERGRRSGQSEGQAMIDASKEMQRLGLYPKSTTMVAQPARCDAASPVVTITDAEFRSGLFPDIEAAIRTSGAEVDKSLGDYITHRDYTTSRQINDYLNAGHSSLVVRVRDGCWELTIHRP
jgi:hypothetical protein